jgi:hypothetical protein
MFTNLKNDIPASVVVFVVVGIDTRGAQGILASPRTFSYRLRRG